jgi:pimeloyl-ACP methyl ester carboxylesterase
MLAARHPGRVGRVMVVDALPFFSLLMDPAATPESVRPQADAARDGLLRLEPAAYATAQRAGLGRLVKDPAARGRHGDAAAASDPGVVARAMHDIMVTDLRPELPRITAPVTVLYAFDPAYGVPAGAVDGLFETAYAGLKGVRVKRVDGAFHFIMDDQPERFAAEVDAFLAAPAP